MFEPLPTDRILVPPRLALPPGMRVVDLPLGAGLPARAALDGTLTLSLVLPTGMAEFWRDADPHAVVDRGGPEVPAAQDSGRTPPPLRLALRRGAVRLGTAPLVSGRLQWIPRTGSAAVIRLVALDWEIRAGSQKGAGDVGSFLRVAWAPVGAAPARFDLPEAPRVLRRRRDGEDQQ